MRIRSRLPYLLGAGVACLGLLLVWKGLEARERSIPWLDEEARKAVQEHRWDDAERLLSRRQARGPLGADHALMQAEVDWAQGRQDAAVQRLREVPRRDPLAASARFAAGVMEHHRHRGPAAVAQFREALELDPTLAMARRELIVLFALQARRRELNEQFRELARIAPVGFDDVLLWTATLEDVWINDSIQEDLKAFLAADSKDRHSRLALAQVLLRAGTPEDAESLVAPLPEDDDDARTIRARIRLARGHDEAARALLAGGSEKHVGLALLRAQLAMRSRDIKAAARFYRLVLSLDPTQREAVQGLGLLLGRMGQAEESQSFQGQAKRWRQLAELLERARGGDARRDGSVLKELGAACEALGRKDEARAWYQLALAVHPLDESAQRALYRLRE